MATEFEKKIKELHMLELKEARKELYKKPRLEQLFLEVTSRCNARCEHCGSRCDGNMQGEEISTECLKNTLQEIADHYDAKEIFLAVTGGEPLMRKDLFEIMEFAVELGFSWGITSNGMLINKSMIKKMEKSKMATVSISIDGLKETHESFRKVPNSFEKILEGIRMMQESPVIKIVQVTTVVNKKNIHELEDLYKLLLEHGVEHWRVVNCDPIGRALDNNHILLDKKDYKYLFYFILVKQKLGEMKSVTYGCSHYVGLDLEREVRDNYFLCMTGLLIGSILSNGDIYVCPNVPRRKELIQGNIKTDSFVDVWENKFEYFRNGDRCSCDTCKKCKHWNYCAGDAMHTWNFDDNEPLICLKDVFEDM